MVSQLILHEGDSVKCSLTFNRPKNLDNNNFNKFNVFQKLVVNDDKCKKNCTKTLEGDWAHFPHAKLHQSYAHGHGWKHIIMTLYGHHIRNFFCTF